MSNQMTIQQLDDIATQIGESHGYDSEAYFSALADLDYEIEQSAISCDDWSDAEIRAMSGEAL